MNIRQGLAAVVFCSFFAVGAALAQAPTQPRLENDARLRGDMWVTHVLYRGQPLPGLGKPSAKPGGGGGGGGGSGGGSCSTTKASFTGSGYSVIGGVVDAETTPNDAEEEIAVDPQNGNHVLAAISDFTRQVGLFLWNTTEYSYSTDNGGTWHPSFLPLNSSNLLVTSDGNQWCANSDPVTAYDASGNAYMVDLYLVANQCNAHNKSNGLYVSYSPAVTSGSGAGSVSFAQAATKPVVAPNLSSSTSVSEDKPWVAVDNSSGGAHSHSGRVYVSWTHFTSTADSILVSSSNDHGATWSTPLQVNPAGQNGAVQGSQIAVGSDGTVYVAYEVFFSGGLRQQFLAVSTDGGGTFTGAGTNTSPQTITPFFNELSFSSNYRKNSFPALAVSGTNVYAVYADQPSNCGAELEFVTSSNSGGTFNSPVAINDNLAGDHFMPGIAVDSTGGIHVSWFDTRNYSTSSDWDIYVTRSTNAGVAFSSNQQVNVVTYTSGSASSTFIGDYSGNAAGMIGTTPYAHPAWTSGSYSSGGDLETAALH